MHKMNYLALESALKNHFKEKAFHAIVNTAFIKSLAFESAAPSKELVTALSHYSSDMLNRLGGVNVLESAVSNTSDTMKAFFLVNMNGICDQIAEEAATRVVNETRENNEKYPSSQTENIVEIVGKSKFSTDEYQKFVKAVNSTIDPEKIGNIIKDKTIETIKEEKEAYDKAKEIDDEITKIVTPEEEEKDEAPMDEGNDDINSDTGEEKNNNKGDANDEDEEGEDSTKEKLEAAKESFIRFHGIRYTDAREHASFYSRLHEMAYESMLLIKSQNIDGVAIDNLKDIAIESASILYNIESPSLKDKIETVGRMRTTNNFNQSELHEIMESSMATATVLYSFYETLNTMNLLRPSMEGTMSLVDGHHTISKVIADSKSGIKTDIDNLVTSIDNKLSAIRDENALESVIRDYNQITSSFQVSKDSPLAILGEKIRNKKLEMANKSDGFDKYAMEADISQLDRIHGLTKFRDDLALIEIHMPDEKARLYPVTCYNHAGNVAFESTVSIKQDLDMISAPKYIKQCAEQSKIYETSKSVQFVQDRGFQNQITTLK